MAAHVIVFGLPNNITADMLENIVNAIRGTFKNLGFDSEKVAVWMPGDLLPLDLGNNVGIFVEGLRWDATTSKQRSNEYEDIRQKLAMDLLDLAKNFIIPECVPHCKEFDVFVSPFMMPTENGHAKWERSA